MNLAIYGRVSDKDRQGNNFSISTQLQLMREDCIKAGWNVLYELSDKDSAWRDGLERSQLNKALDLAEGKKVDALMFFSPDRFTRDVGDGVIMRRKLQKCGVKLFYFSPRVTEVMTDMELRWILEDYANQQYVEKMREASIRGLRGKVELGLFPQGTCPYGYILTGKQRSTVIEIDEEVEESIVFVYRSYYFDNLTCEQIAHELNGKGVLSNALGRGDGTWSQKRVLQILKNESYAGVWYAYTWERVAKRKWRKRPVEERVAITIPAMISHDFWEMVQEKIRSRHSGRADDSEYLVSCRIRCTCGRAMGGRRSQNYITPKFYYYYRCTSDNTPQGACGMKQWVSSEVDETVWQFAYELIREPRKLLEAYRQMQESEVEHHDTLHSRIGALDEQIGEQEKQLLSIIDQRTKTTSPTLIVLLDQRKDEYALAIDQLKTRKASFEAELRNAPFTDEHIDALVSELTAVAQVCEALQAINEEADFSARRTLVELLDLRATLRIDEEGEKWVDIHWMRKTEVRKLCSQNPLMARH